MQSRNHFYVKALAYNGISAVTRPTVIWCDHSRDLVDLHH